MTIYRCVGIPTLRQILSSGEVVFVGANSDYMSLNQGKVTYLNYDLPSFGEFKPKINFRGTEYNLSGSGVDFTFQSVKDGKLFLEKDGVAFKAAPELVYALICSQFFLTGETLFPLKVEDEGGRRLLFCDIDNDYFAGRELHLRAPSIFGQSMYGVRMRSLCKLDRTLSDVWMNSDIFVDGIQLSGSVRSWSPKLCKNKVLVYLGHIHDHTFERDGFSYRFYKKGILCAVNDVDGRTSWIREFDWSIEDMLVHNEQLYVITGDSLQIIHPETGETIKAINTRLNMPGHRGAELSIASLLVVGEELYFMPVYEPRIVVFDVDTLQLQREYQLENNWCPRTFQAKSEDGRLFFEVQLSAEGGSDFNRHGILELDPCKDARTLAMEVQPDLQIELRPSLIEPGKLELWISIRCESLDDALRFGELYVQNVAFVHGWHASLKVGDANQLFNGAIHFRYSGCNQPADKVQRYMNAMETRFQRWNNGVDGDGIYLYAGDGSNRLCTLDAMYEN